MHGAAQIVCRRCVYWRETGASKAISATISGAEIAICYARALYFAVPLVLLRGKTTSQDSNADTKIMEATRSGLPMGTAAMENASLCEQMKADCVFRT